MDNLLQIEQLETVLHTSDAPIRAVDRLSLSIAPGETFALLGESGCGKSMTALSIMRLLPDVGEIIAGKVKIHGTDILQLPETGMRKIRGKRISMIFQEPMLSLNPVMTIAEQITEVLKQHLNLTNDAAQQRIRELLEQVGIPDAPRRMHEYPFQFSGGMKQRAMIAMALACEPELLVADEPTTALDVTIQAQILELLDVQRKTGGLSILLITHDLGIVAERADHTAVMYAGQVVESAPTSTLLTSPRHPYTEALLASLPQNTEPGRALPTMPGQLNIATAYAGGCSFAERCPLAEAACYLELQQLREVAPSHTARCWKCS